MQNTRPDHFSPTLPLSILRCCLTIPTMLSHNGNGQILDSAYQIPGILITSPDDQQPKSESLTCNGNSYPLSMASILNPPNAQRMAALPASDYVKQKHYMVGGKPSGIAKSSRKQIKRLPSQRMGAIESESMHQRGVHPRGLYLNPVGILSVRF